MTDTQAHIDFWNEYYAEHANNPRAQEWRVLCARLNVGLIEQGLRATGQTPGRMIEIGCGDGALIAQVVGNGLAKSVVGYEISETAAEYVRTRDLEGVESVHAFDGVRLPNETDDSYDLAVISEVIEHAEQPVVLLGEAGRLAPVVAVQVFLTDTLAARRQSNQLEEQKKLHRLSRFSVDTARATLAEAGLTVVYERVSQPSFELRTFWDRSRRSMARESLVGVLQCVPPVGRRLFGSTYTAICRRASAG
jgi:SAM-dependent methyltransferase